LNTFLVKNLLFVLFFFASCLSGLQYAYGQTAEICDNALDDDGDGLIDLNDPDCNCPIELPTSLIPNPSFEENSGCPNNEGQLDLAIAWAQASDATTDYMNTCGFLVHPVIGESPPLPMPDGEGCIGFRNGKPSSPDFKECTGTCLLSPLKAGTQYTINMWVGFGSANTSPEFELVIYGANGCDQTGILPYAPGNPNIGCPLNVPGYERLGATNLNGTNEWVNTDISFTPTRDLDVIVIGPNCEPNAFDHYYYFDNLIIQESVAFGEPPSITGHPCLNNVSLDIPSNFIGDELQWYRDGIAILGETSADFTIPTNQEEQAVFQVRIIREDGTCEISAPYTFIIPEYTTFNDFEICDNTPIQLNNQTIMGSGTYSESFITEEGCDSTVISLVTVLPTYDLFYEETICVNQDFTLGTQVLNQAGTYTEFFSTLAGCDSVVTVQLDVRDALITVDAQGDGTIRLGEIAPIRAEISDLSQVMSYSWSSSDSLVSICDTCLYQVVQPTKTTTYTFTALDTAGCATIDNIVVDVEDFYEVFFPSAFTPNGDGINDFFYPFATSNVSNILSLDIYDRWGNQVFSGADFPHSSELFGWDGSFRNKPSNPGVFVYMATIEFFDGHIDTYKGDFVLLR
jgi:gliding motility-associated-like protein